MHTTQDIVNIIHPSPCPLPVLHTPSTSIFWQKEKQNNLRQEIDAVSLQLVRLRNSDYLQFSHDKDEWRHSW